MSPFDYPFLQAEYRRLGTDFLRPVDCQMCTVELARLMLADLLSRSLPQLVRHFQFPITTSHRAEADAQACWLLAQRLLSEIVNEDDASLLARFAQQWLPLKEVAALLQASSKQTQAMLSDAKIEGRSSQRGRTHTMVYRRGDVERMITQRQEAVQLSWF
jgi:DNA polymerase-3 subunit epsilon